MVWSVLETGTDWKEEYLDFVGVGNKDLVGQANILVLLLELAFQDDVPRQLVQIRKHFAADSCGPILQLPSPEPQQPFGWFVLVLLFVACFARGFNVFLKMYDRLFGNQLVGLCYVVGVLFECLLEMTLINQ